MTKSTYFENFQNLQEVLKYQGFNMGYEPGLVKHELNSFNPPIAEIDDAAPDQRIEAIDTVCSRYTAISFVMITDRNRYGNLLEDLKNQHTQGFRNVFLPNLIEAYCSIIHWQYDTKNIARMMYVELPDVI